VSRSTRPGVQARWRTPPAVMILLELEARPPVVIAAIDEAEYRRLRDWLSSWPELLALLDAADELERRTA